MIDTLIDIFIVAVKILIPIWVVLFIECAVKPRPSGLGI